MTWPEVSLYMCMVLTFGFVATLGLIVALDIKGVRNRKTPKDTNQ